MKVYQPLLYVDWNLLFTVVTLLVLFLILKHFFFEKVHNFMEAREKMVTDSLLRAEDVNREAEEKLQLYEEKLQKADDEGREIVKAARSAAKLQAGEIVDEADKKARNLIEHAQKEIRREEYHARKSLQEEISDMALLAAEQILQEELTPERKKQIVEQILQEAGEHPWKTS